MQYAKTPTQRMCHKLDYPPVSSTIIWAKQVGINIMYKYWEILSLGGAVSVKDHEN